MRWFRDILDIADDLNNDLIVYPGLLVYNFTFGIITSRLFIYGIFLAEK